MIDHSVWHRLVCAVQDIDARLAASTEVADLMLRAALRAAEADPSAMSTHLPGATANAAVVASVLAERWARRHGVEEALGRALHQAAQDAFAAVGKVLPTVNDPARRAENSAAVARFFDATIPLDVARCLADGRVGVHHAEFTCEQGVAPVQIVPGTVGKRQRLLALRVSASPYAATGELVAVASGKTLLARERLTPHLPWRPEGWCEAPPGEAIAFRYLGPITSHHGVAATVIPM